MVRTLVGEVMIRFLIDTGADFSLAPRYVATLVGLDWESLPTSDVRGITQERTGARISALPLRVGDVEFSVRCTFIDAISPVPLLGCADFLDRFALTIDARAQRITLTDLA
jgi:hypothetical protein